MSDIATTQSTLSTRTVAAGLEVLAGRRRGLRALLPFTGPAVIASVAYMDPGNFATNIQAGARFGPMLLWVVVLANVIAMLIQAQSARLGIVTGESLAGLCRRHFPPVLVWPMWALSEIAAMATDLAETLGAAIGLSLLLGMPLMPALLVVFVMTYAMLLLQYRGFRPIEALIGAFVSVIGVAYVVELALAPPDWGQAAFHAVVPMLDGPDSVNISVGIIGATVMPHAIYLHSALTQNRMPSANDADRRKIIGFSNREVIIALGFAGLVNTAMLLAASSMFHAGHADVAEIQTAYHTLLPLFGGAAAFAFMAALMASGLSSSVVGTMAGQVIMQDFVGFSIPLWVRRVVTMLPALIVVAIGFDATSALVISQVVLSLVLPIPMIALLVLTGRKEVMGAFVTGRGTRALIIAATVLVLSLNTVLLAQTAGLM